MAKTEIPPCPICGSGGKVKLVSIDASTVFRPLPEGWEDTVYDFQCDCGWTMPADQRQAESILRRPKPK